MSDLKRKQTIVLIKCCILVACSIGLIDNCIGLFYTPVSEALGAGRGRVAAIATIISISQAFGGQAVARIIKKVPINVVMCAGTVMTSAGLFLFSFLPRLEHFYVIAVIIGLGDICYKNMTISIVLRSWFGEKTASRLGIAMAFSGLAAAVMSPILGTIISSSGYRAGFRLLALLIAVLSIPAAYTCRTRDDSAVSGGSGSKAEGKDAVRTVIPARSMAVMLLIPAFVAGIIGMNTHFSSYAVTLGYSLSFGATVVSFQSIFNSVWKLVFGVIADRIGAARTCMVYLVMIVFSCAILMTMTQSPAAILAGVSIFPAVFSIPTIGIPTIVQDMAKERYGEVYATANMITTLGYAAFTSLYGTISDRAEVYIPCLLIVAVCAVLCAAVCFAAGRQEKA